MERMVKYLVDVADGAQGGGGILRAGLRGGVGAWCDGAAEPGARLVSRGLRLAEPSAGRHICVLSCTASVTQSKYSRENKVPRPEPEVILAGRSTYSQHVASRAAT